MSTIGTIVPLPNFGAWVEVNVDDEFASIRLLGFRDDNTVSHGWCGQCLRFAPEPYWIRAALEGVADDLEALADELKKQAVVARTLTLKHPDPVGG